MSERVKQFMSAQEFRVCLAQQAGHLIGSLFVTSVADSNYYLAPVEDCLAIMHAAKIDALNYVEEISDCDDFNRKLVSAFLDDAYREIDGRKVRRPPYLFGEADSWDHAFNVMVNEDRLLRFVEPQTSEIMLPADMRTGIVEVRV